MKVAIFRLQLFKPSEPFIAAQACALPTIKPVLIGRTINGPVNNAIEYWCPKVPSFLETAAFLSLANPKLYLPCFERHKFSLIHAHFAVDALYALPIARIFNIPLVTTLHGFDVTTRKRDFLRSGRPALVRYAMLQERLKRCGSLFLCVSDYMRERASAAGFPDNRLIVHYMGIDAEVFQPQQCVAQVKRLVHIARLVEKKGTSYLLDAMVEVRKKHPTATLDIIGDGPLREILEAQVHEHQLMGAVTFLGVQPQTKVKEILSNASILVLPSVTASNGDAEGLGLVLLEAAASGVPVVGTRHGGIPEVILHDVTGLLVPEKDPIALAEALNALLDDNNRRQRMAVTARRLVEDQFDIRVQSAKLEDHYHQVL